jgi:RNA polymerase sigma-70 factor (ECF subfamily)
MGPDAGSVTANAICLSRLGEPTLMAEADADLVEGCRAGDLRAFERLYTTHGPRMKSVALNLTGNVPDAEDAVQETFLKVYRSVDRFKGQAALSTWIYRILVNTCHDLGRRRRRRPEAPEEEVGDGSGSAPVTAGDPPLRVTLEKSLDRLGERQRTVFLLFEVEGFTHREIGELLEISEGTSKFLLFDAKRQLQRLLAGKLAGRPGLRAKES